MNPDNKNKIIELVGSNTYDYATSHILGNSSNVVMPNRYDNSSSISTSATYDVYKTSVSEILYELRIMTRDVISKMIKSNYLTNTVTITLRDSSFKTITRQKKLDYTDDFNDIFEVVVDLLDDNFIDGTEYRLVGVGLSNLVDKKDLPKEYNLFTVSDMKERDIILDDLISDFQHKYGKDIIFKNKDKK